MTFPLGSRPIFQGQTVSFREGNLPKGIPPPVINYDSSRNWISSSMILFEEGYIIDQEFAWLKVIVIVLV